MLLLHVHDERSIVMVVVVVVVVGSRAGEAA